MRVSVITPPGEVVSREEVKQHCKIESSDDDTLVDAYIDAAVRWLDGPAGWLGRALGKQTLELSGWFGCRCIRLPYPPIIGNISIRTEDAEGNEMVADPATYRLRDGEVIVNSGATWVSRPVHRIRYDAGYSVISGDPPVDSNVIPSPIKVAIFMLVAHWHENRKAASDKAPSEVPFAVEALLSPYRVWA